MEVTLFLMVIGLHHPVQTAPDQTCLNVFALMGKKLGLLEAAMEDNTKEGQMVDIHGVQEEEATGTKTTKIYTALLKKFNFFT